MRSHALGLTARASETVTVGVAYGQSWNTGSFGQAAGDFKMVEKIWSLFGSMKWGGFYGTGVVSLSDIEYKDVHRSFALGQVTRVASSSPEGSNGSASLIAGYDFRLGRFLVGPTLGVTTQNVTVNGFDEAGGGSAGLRIYEQKRRSEVWSGGVRASMELGNWTPWVRVTADKERRDDLRFVTATPLSLAAIGNKYDIPAYAADSNFTTAAIGLNGRVAPNVALSLGYFKVSGRSGIREDGATAVVSVKF